MHVSFLFRIMILRKIPRIRFMKSEYKVFEHLRVFQNYVCSVFYSDCYVWKWSLNADTQIQNWMYVYFILILLLITYMGVNDPLNRKLGMSCFNLFIS